MQVPGDRWKKRHAESKMDKFTQGRRIICFHYKIRRKSNSIAVVVDDGGEPQSLLQTDKWLSLIHISVIIMLFFYYSIGTSMERTWGTFRYNLYLFSGILFTVIGAFILYFIFGGGYGYGWYFSSYYLCLSIFLAFAASYPDMEVLLYFVIPLKVKWLAWLDVAYLAYDMIRGGFATRVVIIASLLNFVLFYFSTKNLKPYSPKERVRKAKYKQKMRPTNHYANGAKMCIRDSR